MGYSVVAIEQIEPVRGVIRFVRRELGVEAFGINWYEIPPNTEGHEHDESESQQEEVNVVVRGTGTYVIDGEEVAVQAPMAFRFDPETRRKPIGGPDGMTMIAVGARGGSYEPRGPF
jgi:mannose-6-phosphate isomerase-like protein (cupin superfamily)